MDNDLNNCRVVLVRPQVAGNLGATARIMRNMGLSKLVLVAPEADRDCREARQLSTHGESILDHAHIVSTLGEALADCVLTAATSARIGKLVRGHCRSPDDVMSKLIQALSGGPVALVFGPEPGGLTNEEVTRCHWLVQILSDPTYPTLNLAQAVAICLYELRKAWLAPRRFETTSQAAPFVDQERMFAALQSALEKIHFLYGPKAATLMHALRHLLGRAQPTQMELGLLFGLARQLHWFAARLEDNRDNTFLSASPDDFSYGSPYPPA